MFQPIVHYGVHFLIPLVIALVFFKDSWLKAYLIMIATMIIDLDHLIATPIFDPNRCSINFHDQRFDSQFTQGLTTIRVLFLSLLLIL